MYANLQIGLLPVRKNACSRAHMQAFSHEKYLDVRNLYVKCLNWIGLIQHNPKPKKHKLDPEWVPEKEKCQV